MDTLSFFFRKFLSYSSTLKWSNLQINHCLLGMLLPIGGAQPPSPPVWGGGGQQRHRPGCGTDRNYHPCPGGDCEAGERHTRGWQLHRGLRGRRRHLQDGDQGRRGQRSATVFGGHIINLIKRYFGGGGGVCGGRRGLKRDVVYLGWLIAPSLMSPNAGRGVGVLQGLSQWAQLCTGAQVKFGDLTPYLTYGETWWLCADLHSWVSCCKN